MLYRIRQKIRGIKFSPIACPLYWGKIFAKFNFANCLRSTLQEVVGGGRAYRIMLMGIPTVRGQKIQRVEIHSGRKYSTKNFSPLTSTGEIGENFLLAKFLSYTVSS